MGTPVRVALPASGAPAPQGKLENTQEFKARSFCLENFFLPLGVGLAPGRCRSSLSSRWWLVATSELKPRLRLRFQQTSPGCGFTPSRISPAPWARGRETRAARRNRDAAFSGTHCEICHCKNPVGARPASGGASQQVRILVFSVARRNSTGLGGTSISDCGTRGA